MWARLRSRARALLGRRRFEDDLADELAFHLQARTDHWIAQGMNRSEAARRARLEFGSPDKHAEACRESRGRQDLRNIVEPVEIFAVVRVDENADHLVVDPVCQMAVDPERAVGRLLLDESTHYFCSLSCVAAFSQNPRRYA